MIVFFLFCCVVVGIGVVFFVLGLVGSVYVVDILVGVIMFGGKLFFDVSYFNVYCNG